MGKQRFAWVTRTGHMVMTVLCAYTWPNHSVVVTRIWSYDIYMGSESRCSTVD